MTRNRLSPSRRREDIRTWWAGLYTYAAQYLACTYPDRRCACRLTTAHARLGANVDRYSFIAMDFHHLLSAGLPAHRQLP